MVVVGIVTDMPSSGFRNTKCNALDNAFYLEVATNTNIIAGGSYITMAEALYDYTFP